MSKVENVKKQESGSGQVTVQEALDFALQEHSAGRLAEAEGIYQQVLEAEPDHPVAKNLLGVIAHKNGNTEKAWTLITQALATAPDYPEAHSNLGKLLEDLGRMEEAVISYKKALALNPDFDEAHFNLGNALADLGKLDEAVISYQKALAIDPNYTNAHYHLGNSLKSLGRLNEAVASYHKAIAIKPDFTDSHFKLGNTLYELNKQDEAVESYRKALAIKPDFAASHCHLGVVLQAQGNVDDAKKHLELAISYKPEMAGWRIRKALLLPVIPYSKEVAQVHRENLCEAVRALQKENLTIENPLADIGTTNFHLAYHNQDDRSIMEDIANLHAAACPKLTYEAKHCGSKKGGQKDRLRIGFLSTFFWNHTIGKLTRGIIEHLSRDHFEVIVFQFSGKKDKITEVIEQAADKVVPLHKILERDREIIAKEELDILYFPEIGMEPYSYFLSFARLAPVQAVTWGHPDTTGVPNIDYFLSSELLEVPDASEYYSEQLITLKNVNTYYFRPDPPKKTYTRDDYGLPHGVRLYICPQSLFKLHPEFDNVIGDLLRRDPEGRLVFIDDGRGGHWSNLIIERLSRSCPDIVDHVIFVPLMVYEKFLGLLILADALLDVPTFSGGNSSLEALAMGAPIVAWPSDFLRGRITTALYKQMGLTDLIATDAESYITLALRLAQDSDFKRRIQADIKANSHKLYERIEVVREMESFFIQAYNSSQKGEILTDVDFKKAEM